MAGLLTGDTGMICFNDVDYKAETLHNVSNVKQSQSGSSFNICVAENQK